MADSPPTGTAEMKAGGSDVIGGCLLSIKCLRLRLGGCSLARPVTQPAEVPTVMAEGEANAEVESEEAPAQTKGVHENLAEAVATAVPASSQGSLVADVADNRDESTADKPSENTDDQATAGDNQRRPVGYNRRSVFAALGSNSRGKLLLVFSSLNEWTFSLMTSPGVCERLEQSHRLCDRLRIMLEERANVERSYAASLERLARKAKEAVVTPDAARPGSETALSAFEGYIGSVMHRAEQSRQLAGDLAGEVVPSLGGTLKQHGQVYQRIRVDGMKLAASLQEQYRLHDETVLRYDDAAQRADHLMRDLAADTTHDPSSRLRLAVTAAEAARLTSGCEEDYRKAVLKVNTERQRFVAHMDIIMDALQDMEVKRERCFKDALRKTLVYDAAWIRNVEYDLNQAIPGAEAVDPEGDTGQFARDRYARRAEAIKGGQSLHPSKERPDPPGESNGSAGEKSREATVSQYDEFIESVWSGAAAPDDSKELVDGLRDYTVRMELLAKTCGVALDLADQQMDGETAGQIAGVSLRISAVKEDGKRHSLMQELYYHPIWSRVLIWEDILLWAIADSCMDEQKKRAGWPEGDAADKPYMVSISNFGEILLHYGVQANNGRDLVVRCIARMEEPLGRGALDDVKATLLNSLAIAEVKEAQPATTPPSEEEKAGGKEEEKDKCENAHTSNDAAREDVFA
ncbi:hypothetical protein FOZ60_004082 [Perkinsus olseni]|uniref:FCH domain-containing protein n=1 Tax=Perkinsus olseni TaxID=32597 RepID=A0A7J6PHI5_PEROL|nr:hypothetical protein FOZ60_004082 [Perkinsus olseni]